ncbi:MAG: DUF2683 family protein [Nanoarchaeota archaeon]|nr:DUF2683 family protein [Nanoarchaeota archaeon]
MEMVSARIEINEYANKVLAVIKAKFGLRDKSEALNKFIELYGDDFIEREPKEEFIKNTLQTIDKHMKKYGHKKMSLAKLDKLCEL